MWCADGAGFVHVEAPLPLNSHCKDGRPNPFTSSDCCIGLIFFESIMSMLSIVCAVASGKVTEMVASFCVYCMFKSLVKWSWINAFMERFLCLF